MSVCFFVNADQPGTSNAEEVENENAGDETSQAESAQQTLEQFWIKVMEDIRNVTSDDFKTQALPLARIKKIMKLDEEVKMISAEAPVLFAKAAEIFIHELTLRAWSHTEDNKRRTLQVQVSSDSVVCHSCWTTAWNHIRNPTQEYTPPQGRVCIRCGRSLARVSRLHTLRSDSPREERIRNMIASQIAPRERNDIAMAISKSDQFDFLIDIVPRHEVKPVKTVWTKPHETVHVQEHHPVQNNAQQQIVLPCTQIVQTSGATPTTSTNVQQPLTVMQQVVTPSGEVQNMPQQIQLTQAQLNLIRLQVQNNQQPIIIQAQHQQSPQIIQVTSQAQHQPQQQQVYLAQVATSQDDS